ncbi:beta-ketoacyl-ACP synthase 3 [Streptomyces curacoi]|uniref:3-oxoacyl-ACP synthase n=1 Tax=Streptomyces curacoi TaxID=146536 RepID=A0A117P5I4_9ACTN|nr:beta-ketoacyl-ACP synthase 3 [Streptomyces curacoi]KUM73392.1 3-oxoacyl-ACP synthase [Streptomyces curacoi]
MSPVTFGAPGTGTTAVVAGTGGCLPARVLANDDVIAAGALNTTDEWLRTRTGIARRRRTTPGTGTGALATAAARAALRSAAAAPGSTPRPDLVLLATTTPDHPCPASAPEVAHRLGLNGVPAFDLAAVCSGFVYGLTVATALVRGGVCSAPLVIGADAFSSILDPADRETAPIFGDGAGAVLLRRGGPDEPGAVLAADLGADGAGRDLITVPGGGSRAPWPADHDARCDHRFRMRGREVYAHAVRRMTASSRAVLDQLGWPADSVRAFVAHQANQRILDAVADRLGIPPERRLGNLSELGNTAAASIPLVLADGSARNGTEPGARTLLTAFGGGLTWGSTALTWPVSEPRITPPEPETDNSRRSNASWLPKHSSTPPIPSTSTS